MAMTPADVIKMAQENGAEMLDLKFTDFPGMWQHFSVPIGALDEDLFEDGLGFDGSSIRGWRAINESDMLVIPDAETAITFRSFSGVNGVTYRLRLSPEDLGLSTP